MNEFSNFHKRLSDFILATTLINNVSWGDVFDLDLEKRNQYALAHINYESITVGTSHNTVALNIILADLVNDNFENTLDVYNQMVVVATMIVKSIDGGNLYDYSYRLDGTATMELFKERFTMNLAGVTLSINVMIPNNITRCS